MFLGSTTSSKIHSIPMAFWPRVDVVYGPLAIAAEDGNSRVERHRWKVMVLLLRPDNREFEVGSADMASKRLLCLFQ
jgi:hypothetical protein